MTLPRTVSDVLAEHTVFEIECIDRMYLNVYVPQLQYPAGLVGYVQRQLGLPIASTAPLGKITDAFSAAMRRFAVDQGVPWLDFVIGKRLTNLPALCEVGFTANRRLLDVQRLSHDPARGRETFTAVNDPVTTEAGTRVADLRFADARAQALLCALLVFRLLPNGFINRDLRDLVGQLLDKPMSPGQMTYDLRRLRAHGLITRIPHSHRYHLTDTGLHHALFLTRTHDRLLRTGLAQLTDPEPHPLRTASRAYQRALDTLAAQSGLAA
jgi:hypothetical protein